MAVITNYSSLQLAVADYMARDDLTTFLPNFIQSAERKLNAKLNLRNEETALNISVSSGVGAVPTDFKALKFAYRDASPADLLQWVPIEDLYREYPTRTNVGVPVKISREAGNFVFGPAPSDFTLKGVYYAKQDSLVDTDPSWYVTNHPEALLYGALMEGSLFIRDPDGYNFWSGMFANEVALIQEAQQDSETSFGALEVRVA